jgi:hypothetical protein
MASIDTEKPQDIEKYATKAAVKMNDLLNPGSKDSLTIMIQRLVEYREFLQPFTRKDLASVMEGAAERILNAAKLFKLPECERLAEPESHAMLSVNGKPARH